MVDLGELRVRLTRRAGSRRGVLVVVETDSKILMRIDVIGDAL